MTPIVEVKPLSLRKRQFVFFLSLTLFIIAVPISVFYAIGYRFDFNDEITTIKSVGGMYVRNDTENTEMFINDQPVEDMRVFQSAAYIQNLEAGMHRLHIQGPGVQTWVKNLPVHAHYVTEVTSFNMPKVPQIRIIAEYLDASGRGVVFDPTASTTFAFASTTNLIQISTSTATSSYVSNPEYAYIQNLIASSTEIRAVLEEQRSRAEREPFTFGSLVTPTVVMSSTATSTRTWREFSLHENNGEVFMSWNGSLNDIPYYYCVMYGGEKKTSSEYGEHVYEAIQSQLGSTTNLAQLVGERVCRETIRIDRLDQEVHWFDFYPDSADIVLVHLDDGLHAVEVDDRAWQNTQLLYPGEDITVVQDGGRIYVQDGDYYLEVFTEIASQS